jgi:hypothetical protein
MSRAKPLKMFNHLNKPLIIDRAMIELRDRLATEKGYVRRGAYWERDAAVGFFGPAVRELSDGTYRFWPPEIMDAARAIDGEHRARQKPTDGG